MNTYISDWNFDGDFPINGIKNPTATGADNNDLAELLWRNGQVVLQSQTHRKQASNILTEPSSQVLQNPTRPCEDETVSWLQYPPIEDSFEREFCSGFFSGSPSCDPVDADSQMPPPRAVSFRVDSSRCGSNQEAARILPRGESERTETVEPSSSGGSGSSFGRATTTSGNTNNKRKCREAELESQSEDAELESKPKYKSVQGSGTSSRKSRAAEVHNLSERRRRDRINEKMKALQELIPHSNKTDKASMLDEAIEYLKSLQLQLQVMWMGSGVTPMMFPGVQAHYMSRVGPPSMPSAMHLPGRARHGPVAVGPAPDPYSAAFANPLGYQAHAMQSASLAEQYARFMPMNVFRFSPHTIQGQYLMAQQLLSNGPSSSGGAQINGGLNGKNMG